MISKPFETFVSWFRFFSLVSTGLKDFFIAFSQCTPWDLEIKFYFFVFFLIFLLSLESFSSIDLSVFSIIFCQGLEVFLLILHSYRLFYIFYTCSSLYSRKKMVVLIWIHDLSYYIAHSLFLSNFQYNLIFIIFINSAHLVNAILAL